MTFAVGLLGGARRARRIDRRFGVESPPASRPVKRRTLEWGQVAAAAGVGRRGGCRDRPRRHGMGGRRTRRRRRGLAGGPGVGGSRRRPRQDQARIEALAAWCEQLRDLLVAEHGIIGTIAATVRTCPAAIRTEVARLASRLGRQSADGRSASSPPSWTIRPAISWHRCCAWR